MVFAADMLDQHPKMKVCRLDTIINGLGVGLLSGWCPLKWLKRIKRGGAATDTHTHTDTHTDTRTMVWGLVSCLAGGV